MLRCELLRPGRCQPYIRLTRPQSALHRYDLTRFWPPPKTSLSHTPGPASKCRLCLACHLFRQLQPPLSHDLQPWCSFSSLIALRLALVAKRRTQVSLPLRSAIFARMPFCKPRGDIACTLEMQPCMRPLFPPSWRPSDVPGRVKSLAYNSSLSAT
ncbi:hypothetical protein B0J13DRAFT_170387 [Dactylonectria estremocensis]|uniref:Uncharacterized protein n=1 Tax=Dactylonectria estremocensis TaxID=1079267 RepID=A0A9P9FBQ0_9HYPO|nr:hypothetical protein B0J13DRAFT_170387 [Dactylonectria estremocensis]